MSGTSQTFYKNTLTDQHRMVGVYAFVLTSSLYLGWIQPRIGGSGIDLPIPIYLVLFLVIGVSFRDFKIFLTLFTGFVFWTVIQVIVGVPSMNFVRTGMGLCLLALMTPMTIKTFQRCQVDDFKTFFTIVKFVLYAQLIEQIGEVGRYMVTGYDTYYHYFLPINRPDGFSTEPSGFARVMSPIIFIIVVFWKQAVKYMGINAILAFSVSCFLSLSTSLVMIFALGFGVLAISRRSLVLLIFGVGAIFAVILGATFLVEDVEKRVSEFVILISQQNTDSLTNLSVQVLLKGAEYTYIALTSYPLGVGILNMQSLEPFSTISALFNLETLNSEDGSSILFKGLSEFGWIYFIFVAYSIKIFSRFLKSARHDVNSLVICMFIFAIFANFIRGAGYFDGPQLVGIGLVFAGMFGLLPSPKIEKKVKFAVE